MNRIFRLVSVGVLAFALVGGAHAETAHPARSLTTPELVRLASQSVVRIDVEGPTTETVTTGVGPDAETKDVEGYGIATGTGFVIDDAGHVVTNNHVVHPKDAPFNGTTRLTVELPKDFNPHPASFHNKAERDAYAQVVVHNGRSYLVNPPVVGYDEKADLAVVQIPVGLLKPLKFARPESVEVGEDVVAIGFALSLTGRPTVTKGIVSAVGRSYSAPDIEAGDLIQTDAAINHGNSGGPLLNAAGEVVGVNTYTLADPEKPQTQGMYLARSSRTAERYVEAMIREGGVARGDLGVETRTVGLLDSRALDIPTGVLITDVEPGSAAEAAGLHANEMILRVGGREVQNIGDLNDALALVKPGSAVEVEYQDVENQVNGPRDDDLLGQLAQALLGQTDKNPAPQTAIVVVK